LLVPKWCFDPQKSSVIGLATSAPKQGDREATPPLLPACLSPLRSLNAVTTGERLISSTCSDAQTLLTWIKKLEPVSNEAWVDTDQERTYKLEGDMLYIISMTQPNVNFGGRMMTGILSWERER
jgi:hypothetical protein